MWLSHIKKGWPTVFQQRFILCILFIYQFAWGFWLYRFAQSVVLPIMHRYPGNTLSSEDIHLFLVETQFRLTKTELVRPYLWTLAVMLLIRLFMTPLMNAGIYYSLFHPTLNSGYRFVQGVRRLGLPFLLIYIVKMVLVLLPLWWLVPHLGSDALHHIWNMTLLRMEIVPLGIYLSYLFSCNLLFMYIQFAAAGSGDRIRSFLRSARLILPIISVFLLMLLLSLLIAGLTFAASMVWAGLIAVIGHQFFYVVRVILKLWNVSAQYHIWKESAQEI